MAPLIGITTNLLPRSDLGGWLFHMVYSRNAFAIEQAGGLPLLIPSGLRTDTLRQIYEHVDGILVPGGGDINPAQYGEAAHPKTAGIDDLRDAAEAQVIRWAVEDDRPVLGICRGNQMVNVALGGTLIQDVPSETDTPIRHNYRASETPLDFRAHAITVKPHSRLAQILQTQELDVNSLHHQAVDLVAPGLEVAARGPDQLVEALEMPGKRFVLSVQWHPENLTDDPTMLALFQAFVAAAETIRA
ncbi:MAG: gamma-glutamyl-gamma-aminobutyrate hydrolase family protein [Anaerolineae bacterium]|nr:gamma-glutamyl-gamma-aminobutyrate hydrolase family protein [Anaerolineae bacterium]